MHPDRTPEQMKRAPAQPGLFVYEYERIGPYYNFTLVLHDGDVQAPNIKGSCKSTKLTD